MRARYRKWAMMGALVLSGQPGCMLLDWSGSGHETNAASSGSPPAAVRARQELPPEEAAELWFTLAQELEKSGRETEAIVQYEKARQKKPQLDDQVSRRLAILYDRNGNQARAMVEFQQALKAHPKDADLLSDLGYSYYNRGEWQEAEKYLRKAVAVAPQHKRAWTNLGMSLAQQGRTKESLEAFSKAVSPAEANANLGFILASQGKTAEAQQAYRHALELEPTLQVARVALVRLEKATPADGIAAPVSEAH